MTLLSIDNLSVKFAVEEGQVQAVRGVNVAINKGETLAVVGESGAGKSQVFHAMMGLLPGNGKASGKVIFAGQELLNQPDSVLNTIRGKSIGMIFQDPMTALNPYMRIGRQLTEVLEIHQGMERSAAREIAIDMLDKVHIPAPEQRFNSYPHELSGGMRQRVVIAMALLCQPELLIADEPTTALDVTVQTGIIRLLREIHESLQTSIVLITHDLPLVAGLCERIIVMYAGKIVETGRIEEIFNQPMHPYTRALLAATPQNSPQKGRMNAIAGQPPDPLHLPAGCAFQPRCPQADEECRKSVPVLRDATSQHQYACIKGVAR
jgi:oligopeptide transport system ATP-binding protein